MTTKNTEVQSWSRNIITWGLLGIAAYQFSSLTGKVEKVHELVIKHENQLDNNKFEINRLRDALERSRTQLSETQWNSGSLGK